MSQQSKSLIIVNISIDNHTHSAKYCSEVLHLWFLWIILTSFYQGNTLTYNLGIKKRISYDAGH